ncbi:MAG: hypothetical protein EOO75_06485, partial [Myxococcales bacterium]
MLSIATTARQSLRALLFLGLVALGAGCKPKIGDECSTSIDCSSQGDRLCDTTMPGGYCTLFNCEPDRCPDDGVCVVFKKQPSDAADCDDPQRWLRLQRTFCVRSCGSDDDCRGGYSCIGTAGLESGWQGRVVDRDASSVCLP